MLKKLQNLLFEDDEDEMEDEPEQEPVRKVEPVVQKPVVPTPAPKPVVEPMEEVKPFIADEPKQTMTRIDVTQPIQKVEERPAVEAKTPSFDSIFAEEDKPAAPVKKSIGITLTEEAPVKPVEKKDKPVVKSEVKKEKPAVNQLPYQFKPVISPIFGVDEKDLTAVKSTVSKASAKQKAKLSTNISPIISPMYGRNEEEEKTTVESAKQPRETTVVKRQAETAPRYEVEDDIPEFSLDDILKVRDDEFAEEKEAVKKNDAPLFPDFDFDEEEDQTGLIDKKSLDEADK